MTNFNVTHFQMIRNKVMGMNLQYPVVVMDIPGPRVKLEESKWTAAEILEILAMTVTVTIVATMVMVMVEHLCKRRLVRSLRLLSSGSAMACMSSCSQ
jgi:hypothetical protein